MQIIKRYKIEILLSIIIAIALCFVGTEKVGFHIDEIFTFGTSNHTYDGSLVPMNVEGVEYNGMKMFDEYVSVCENKRFDYKNVFVNQTADVHPPLYYTLIHTVASCFPNEGIVFVGTVVNVLCSIVVFWQMIALFEVFLERRYSILFAVMYMCSMGFVNSVIFFRMYVLLTIWFNFLLILFLRTKPQDDKKWTFYLALYGIVLGGMMTQYYFSIFCAFSCFVYATYVVLLKRWKEFLLCGLSICMALLTDTLMFPAMWGHIFGGYRGREAFSNMTNVDAILQNLKVYLGLINSEIFGGYFIWGVAFIILLYIVSLKYDVKNEKKSREFLQIIIPTVVYVIIVAQISPYKTDRYVMSVFGAIFIIAIVCLVKISHRISNKVTWLVIGMVIFMLCGTYKDGIPNLNCGQGRILNKNIENKNVKFIYVYDKPSWKVLPNYNELRVVENIQFYSIENIDGINEKYNNEEALVVYVLDELDVEFVMETIMNDNQQFSEYNQLFKSGKAIAYYLE